MALHAIFVIPNYELYSELARFGNALRIISPEEIRQEFQVFKNAPEP